MEEAGKFVCDVARSLPLAALFPFVEPIARDKTELYCIRILAMEIMGSLRVNDVVPVFIDLLTDVTKEEPYYGNHVH